MDTELGLAAGQHRGPACVEELVRRPYSRLVPIDDGGAGVGGDEDVHAVIRQDGTVRVTYPFHPWHGREFVLLGVQQTWSQDRVFFLDADGVQAAGRSPFRIADLLSLAGLIDGVNGS